MTTATKSTKTRKEPKPVVSQLVGKDGIEINGLVYGFERLQLPPTRCCRVCVRLYKGEAFTSEFDVRDVAVLDDGRTDCTCEDFIYRAASEGRECKHIIACRACGLLEEVEADLAAEVIAEQEQDSEYLNEMAMEHLRYDSEYDDGDYAFEM